MKILLDANVGGMIVPWLRDKGHEVSIVSERDPKMSDEKILEWATSEGRVLITTDKDFEEMIWREGREHTGVLRIENLPRVERKKLLENVIEQYEEELTNGSIVIATMNKIRIRKSFSRIF